MVYHCGIHLSSRPIGHECSSSITEMCVAVQEESSAVVMDEEIVMDDVFDDESSAHTSNARAALSRAHSSHKKMNSRRSSLGVFGAFSELKMDW